MTDALWNHEDPVADLGIDVPRWIAGDISGSDIAAILHGGCASGAYMPAVTYHQALATMAEYGDEVWDYLASDLGGGHFHPVNVGQISSWAGLACYYVSAAVEAWASAVEDEVWDALTTDEEG